MARAFAVVERHKPLGLLMKQVLLNFFDIFVFVFNILLLIRIVLSWITADMQSNIFVKLIYDLTEPLLGPTRKLLPQMGGLDFSPLALLLALQFAQRLIHGLAGIA